MTAILEVTGLKVFRGDTTILRDVTWRIRQGEHWVILGANGSGKTSLLKALTGFLSPSAGEFTVLGQRYGASDWRALRKKIGIVTSAFNLAIPPAESALETVISGKHAQLDLWAPVSGADRAAAARLLREVDAAGVASRPWLYLSQGERQRVMIARALMARPRLLILDEPCAGLDPVARDGFLKTIERLAARPLGSQRRARADGGPALVLVTHHVEEITPSFTHALLLRRGGMMAAGPVAEVLTSAHLSATFDAPMKLRRTGKSYHLRLAGASTPDEALDQAENPPAI